MGVDQRARRRELAYAVACWYCRVKVGASCVNTLTGLTLSEPHESRVVVGVSRARAT